DRLKSAKMELGFQPCDRRGLIPLQTDKNLRFRPFSPLSPLPATHPGKAPSNPFVSHTSINKRLKVLYFPHIQKQGGGIARRQLRSFLAFEGARIPTFHWTVKESRIGGMFAWVLPSVGAAVRATVMV